MAIIIAGILSGLTASMGLGGGFILIIYLTVFAGMGQTQAAGVNLLFFLPVALISVILHLKNNLVDKTVLPRFCLFGVIGAVLGVVLAVFAPEDLLRNLFACLILLVGIREVFHKSTAKQPESENANRLRVEMYR
jgi:uncharacterized membrane protein YfcA